jgi:hypothetical protein
MRLTVHEAQSIDVYKDIARLHRSARGKIDRGKLARISANGESKLLVIRGLGEEFKDQIMLDSVARSDLRVTEGKDYNFKIEPAPWWYQVQWAIRSADPGTRIAAWLALWSIGVGVVGLLLSLTLFCLSK